MDGHEIITIHFGPYANFIGAFLANNEHRQTFGTTHPVPLTNDTFIYTAPQAHGTSSADSDHAQVGGAMTSHGSKAVQTNPNILFTANHKVGTSISSAAGGKKKNAYYVQRAIYCDFEGAIPVQHASEISSSKIQQAKKKAQQQQQYSSRRNNDYYDPLDLYEEEFTSYSNANYYLNHGNTSQHQQQKQHHQQQQNFEEKLDLSQINEEHLYWHNILYPHLRPMGYCPENVILTAPNHVLGIQHDIFTQASQITKQPVSPTGSTHEETFWDTLLNQFRIITEQCDGLQGVRIIVDLTSIWGGVCYLFLQHLQEDYKSLSIHIIGVSTPLTIESTTSQSLSNELYAYQIYNNLPYSPFNATSQNHQMSPAMLKQQTITTRDKRLYNYAIFTSYIKQFDNVVFCPIAIPLTDNLVKLMSTTLPTLLHKFNNKYINPPKPKKVNTSSLQSNWNYYGGNGGTQRQQEQILNDTAAEELKKLHLNTDTKLLLYSLYKSMPAILYYYITSHYLSLSLYQLWLPLYYIDGSGDVKNATMITLHQLSRTIRPTPSLFVATLLHQHENDLFSKHVLGNGPIPGGNTQSQAQQQHSSSSSSTDHIANPFFPIININTTTEQSGTNSNSGTLQLNILSNLYHNQQRQQQLNAAEYIQLSQFSGDTGTQQPGHNVYNNSASRGSNVVDTLYNGDPQEIAQKREKAQYNAKIDIYTSYTLLNYDNESQLSHLSRPINGVSLNNTQANVAQYQYECQNRFKKLLYSIYSTTNNNPSTAAQSILYNIPHNIMLSGNIPQFDFTTQSSQIQQQNTKDLEIFNLLRIPMLQHATHNNNGSNTPSNNNTGNGSSSNSSTSGNNLDYFNTQSFTSMFISPQLASSFTTLASLIRPQHGGATSLSTSKYIVKSLYNDKIEGDDWDEIFNELSYAALDYKDAQLYDGLDDDF